MLGVPALAVDDARTARIVGEIVDACLQGRKVLVLTERTEHLAAIVATLSGRVQNLITLQGRSSKKQRASVLAALEALEALAHVRIVDFIDSGHPALMRMWARRQVGYRAMGYRVVNSAGDLFADNLQAEAVVGDEPRHRLNPGRPTPCA